MLHQTPSAILKPAFIRLLMPIPIQGQTQQKTTKNKSAKQTLTGSTQPTVMR